MIIYAIIKQKIECITVYTVKIQKLLFRSSCILFQQNQVLNEIQGTQVYERRKIFLVKYFDISRKDPSRGGVGYSVFPIGIP